MENEERRSLGMTWGDLLVFESSELSHCCWYIGIVLRQGRFFSFEIQINEHLAWLRICNDKCVSGNCNFTWSCLNNFPLHLTDSLTVLITFKKKKGMLIAEDRQAFYV